jgi:hypothetical protein
LWISTCFEALLIASLDAVPRPWMNVASQEVGNTKHAGSHPVGKSDSGKSRRLDQE